MPAVRTTTSRVRAVTTRQILNQARAQDRPMRFTRQASSLGYRSEDFDFDPPSPAPSSAPTDTRGSALSKSPSTTPPTTSPASDTTPMSISTQPSTPATPTPISNGTRGFANRRGLLRTYSMILSPGGVPMHPSTPTPASMSTPASSPESTDSERTPQGSPQATAGEFFDDLMNTDADGPRYGKMCQIKRFKLTDVAFDTFNPDDLPESDESLLTRLDCLINAGLSPEDFQKVFIECWKCKGLLARRNVHFHSCADVKASQEFAPLDRFSLLQCTVSGGLKRESFEALMSYCRDCDKYMTHRTSLHHDCVLFAAYFGEDLADDLAEDLAMDLV